MGMAVQEVKPPQGVVARRVHDGNRLTELFDAMERYANARLPVPIEWVEEARSLAWNKEHK